jgi:FixJ family two-component response regulator
MDGMDGLEVLRRRGTVRTPIIVLTGHGSVHAAVEAMQLGAFSFLEKPIDGDVLGAAPRPGGAGHGRRRRTAEPR